MLDGHLVLAGGGHTHALVLRRWIMHPHLMPGGLITLITRNSTTFYSGMVPGLFAGFYKEDDLLIDLRYLAQRAGVGFVEAEIIGLDAVNRQILLENRPHIKFTVLSLDIGADTLYEQNHSSCSKENPSIPIRPLKQAFEFIIKEDRKSLNSNSKAFTVKGAGLSGIEISMALRERWPRRPINLQVRSSQMKQKLKTGLKSARIELISTDEFIDGPILLCTGNKAPTWIEECGLGLNSSGRIITHETLQVCEHPNIFAVGDCGVIDDKYRPPSGVWAVRAAKPLAINLERKSKHLNLIPWRPQSIALQLIGGILIKSNRKVAWASWGEFYVGPYHFLWKWKEFIDRNFMHLFYKSPMIHNSEKGMQERNACRGCAAKVAQETLKDALTQADLAKLGDQPEDSVPISSSTQGEVFFQSVDGFPALLSDPWLNGRLTALHACSDLWGSGASVVSAQAVITLPKSSKNIQQELLAQSLSGIKSALEPQGAKLIGGHTFESISECTRPISLGIQISLCVNGLVPKGQKPWLKSGLRQQDVLLISRGLGSGVLFAAAMNGQCRPEYLTKGIEQLSRSQHRIFQKLIQMQEKEIGASLIHACTDVTGFGLLGHLAEMLDASNLVRVNQGLTPLKIKLDANAIPSYEGAIDLLDEGYFSSLAPANRIAWGVLNPRITHPGSVDLDLGNVICGSDEHQSILELIVDPQTCGPLLISCSPNNVEKLISLGDWTRIGCVELTIN